jgi:hypothetical protein
VVLLLVLWVLLRLLQVVEKKLSEGNLVVKLDGKEIISVCTDVHAAPRTLQASDATQATAGSDTQGKDNPMLS